MPLFLLFLVLLLPCLGAFWLLRCQFQQESNRQRSIRWPRAAAVFPQRFKRLPSVDGANQQQGEVIQYRPRFPEEYVFYAKGQVYAGREIMPAPPSSFSPEDEARVMEALSENRVFYVRFDRDHPTNNFLSVGFPGLPWSRILFYAYLLVGFPGVLWWVYRWVELTYGQAETGRMVLVAFFGFAFGLVLLIYQLLYVRHAPLGLVEGVYEEEDQRTFAVNGPPDNTAEEVLTLNHPDVLPHPLPNKQLA